MVGKWFAGGLGVKHFFIQNTSLVHFILKDMTSGLAACSPYSQLTRKALFMLTVRLLFLSFYSRSRQVDPPTPLSRLMFLLINKRNTKLGSSATFDSSSISRLLSDTHRPTVSSSAYGRQKHQSIKVKFVAELLSQDKLLITSNFMTRNTPAPFGFCIRG